MQKGADGVGQIGEGAAGPPTHADMRPATAKNHLPANPSDPPRPPRSRPRPRCYRASRARPRAPPNLGVVDAMLGRPTREPSRAARGAEGHPIDILEGVARKCCECRSFLVASGPLR
eukprot:2803414-Pyramimonas_sp.AAC.1